MSAFFLDACMAAVQGVLQLWLIGRLAGRRGGIWWFLLYPALLWGILTAFSAWELDGSLAAGLELLALFAAGRFACGCPALHAWTAAVLAVYVPQLSFGLVNSLLGMLCSLTENPLLMGSAVAFSILPAAAVCVGCCRLILKLLSLKEIQDTPILGLLLFPSLFFFCTQFYISQTAYSSITFPAPLHQSGRHLALLFLQALGLGALLCTLYACRRVCRELRTRAALDALTQAAQAQRIYVAEAQRRYEKTRAFRHDVKNHLSVLDGLLRQGETGKAEAYLQKIQTVSDTLSLPCHTGNSVVDILLGEKLEIAESGGMETEVSLALPADCGIDDFDLCVIFANALDNAIAACRFLEGRRLLRICQERQGDFYLLVFENTCGQEPLPPEGTGLSNIRAAAEKYHGAVLTEKAGPLFRLEILLNISERQKDISEQNA